MLKEKKKKELRTPARPRMEPGGVGGAAPALPALRCEASPASAQVPCSVHVGSVRAPALSVLPPAAALATSQAQSAHADCLVCP